MGAAPTLRRRKAFLAAILCGVASAALAGPVEGATPRYVGPKGSDRNLCTRLKPCATFNRAYRLARPGQTVVLRGGRYGSQVIRFDRRKRSTRDVVIRPAAGARVTVRGHVKIYGRHLELRRLTVGTWSVHSRARDVTVRSVKTSRFVVVGARGLSVLGGTLGPMKNASNLITSAGGAAPRAIILDGVTVRGYRRTSGSGPVHCLEVRAVKGLTVRRSRFSDCENSALFFTQGGLAGPPRNVKLENNVLACCRSGTGAVYLDGRHGERWTGFLVRNNSTTGELTVDPRSKPVGPLLFLSNIAARFTGCGRAGIAADYNVWEGGTACGAGDAIALSGFAKPANGNFDLLPGSAAIDRSPSGKYAGTDFSGQRRPIGSAGDAGAYESVSSGLVAAYPFDESGGTTARDVSGMGNNGDVSGATWTARGRLGGALAFDGANDWVTVADAPSLDLSSAMTLEAWVRPTSLGTTWRTAVIKEQPGNLAYALYANTDRRNASGHVFVDADRDTRSASALPLSTWSHVAATYNGSTLRLYVNGNEVSSRAVAGTMTSSSNPLRVGGNSVWNEWFAGQIDEVRVYRRVLSARELKKDMGRALKLPADRQSPSMPTGLNALSVTPSSVSVAWSASSDDVGVAGYGLYRGGVGVGSTAGTSYMFGGLACGMTYTLAVDAYDAAGNRSGEASVTASTSVCPPPDTQAPADPGNLAVSAQTSSSVSVAWSASSDDVGVAGYGLYRGGVGVGSTAGTSYMFGGLACGMTYTLAVDAYDAAGNRSGEASVTASTGACPSDAANIYVSTGGSDSNPCTQAAPCRSFDRAYRVAQPGSVVEVAAGTYGGQTIRADASKTSATDIVFRPSVGATVNVAGEVSVYGSHVEFRDLKFGGWKTFLGTDDVTFRNVETVHLFIWSSSNVSVIGGSVGMLNQKTDYDPNITTASGSSTPPTNILIDGVWFHDWIDEDPGQANHIECLQIGSGVNVTIRNSRFERCGTHDIFIRSWGTLNGSYHPLKNFVVENNFLGKTAAGYYSIQFVDDLATTATSFTVRNNSTLQSFRDAVENGTISFVGNIMDQMTSWECAQSSPSRWSYNVYESGVKCGSSDVVGPVYYRDRARLDLHLLQGSTAIGRGNPASYTPADIDGEARPLGGAPDAGADEVS